MKALLAESNKQDQQLVVPKRNNGGKGKPPHISRTCNLTCLCRYKCDKATSVVATSGYFGAIHWLVDEINACRVICPKNTHGVVGSCD
jgi:hypothetical protein